MKKPTNIHQIRGANKKKATKRSQSAPKSAKRAPKTPQSTQKSSYGGWDGVHSQFMRVEAYAKEESLNRTGRKPGSAQTVEAVLKEVVREEEYSQHVDASKTKSTPPLLIYDGLPDPAVSNPQYDRRHPSEWADDMLNYIDDRLATGVKQYPRQIKGKPGQYQTITVDVDPKQKIMLAGVLSMPKSTTREEMIAWAKDSVRWLKKKYPDGQLKGVLLHQDESCPHLHFYAIPNNKDCDVAHIHDGMKARKAAAKAFSMKKTKKKPNLNGTYKAAMKELQEDYYQSVAVKHNMKRLSDFPGKRVPPEVYKVRKWYQRRLIELQKGYENSISDLQSQLNSLRGQMNDLKELLEDGVANPLNVPKIKKMIRNVAQREADLELMGYKIDLEKDKNLQILELKRESAEEQARLNGEWSVKNKNLGTVTQIKINRVVNENLAYYEANELLKERLAMYEEGFDSPEEALAYNELAFRVQEIEKKRAEYDKREYRIQKTLAAPFYEQRTLSNEDIAYLFQKFIDDLFNVNKVDREKEQLEEMERKRQENIRIRNRIASYDDFED